ncbi:MAG: hypothetical protein KAS04_03130 [Candidatus Aenigmarchaeota archaeon]|nr:hypothetical protein [Candidatus Aenigmarchaeota archaeon]
MATEKLVSLFGVAPADRFVSIVEDLKSNINEKELGEAVRDISSLRAHGPWKSEIKHEDIKIRLPKEYVKNAKSVIVLGMHFPDEVINNSGLDKSKQIGCYTYHQYQTVAELGFAAYELTLMLQMMGYKAMICSNMLGVGSKIDSPRGHLPDMRCSSIEAVAAGLGEIGKSGALLTREHGSHQRCIVCRAYR